MINGTNNKRVAISEEVRDALYSKDVIKKEIDIEGVPVYPKSPEAHGFKGVVWKGLNKDSEEVAIKFTIFEDYMDKSYLHERRCAAKLKKYTKHFSIFEHAGYVEIELPNNKKEKFVCFVESWIDGWTLEKYIKQFDITPEFIIKYVTQMSSALNILSINGLTHDDLHSGNVMIAKPLPGLLSTDGQPENTLSIKIIDMGSLKVRDEQRKAKNDHVNFVEHIVQLYNALNRKQPKSSVDLKLLKNVKPLIVSMLDDDFARALIDPASIIKNFTSAWERSQISRSGKKHVALHDPFEYIAAEHIVDDNILIKLFAESCPWLDKVASPDPILLTGPRGCGKSMAFRRLSLRALLNKTEQDILQMRIAGFYLSCSADMRNRFAWITEVTAKRFRKEIIHYFNLLLIREITLTFNIITKRPDRVSLFTFGDASESKFYDFIMEKIYASDLERYRLQGTNKMQHAIDIIDKHLDGAYSSLIEGKSLIHVTTETFITDTSRFIVKYMPFFKERRPAFLIDDYSVHRVPKCIQEILNILIWDRQPSHVFKISSEKYGVERGDIKEGTVDPTREMREIDAGYEYLDLSDRDKVESSFNFAKELLAKRLKLAQYKGTPEEIVGHSLNPEGSIGNALRASYGNLRREENIYFGLETIANTCSGDISVLLEVYRKIFSDGRVTKGSQEPVQPHVQHRAIVSESRTRLELIKSYPKYGENMFQIVSAFGTLSRDILQYGELMGKDQIVPQTTRIEVDQKEQQPGEELTMDQLNTLQELIRRSVFIEMEPGRSRHKNVLTLRLQLRRIYCPAFGTSLAKNTAVKWDPQEFKDFLLRPTEACKTEFKKRWLRTGSQPTSATSESKLPLEYKD